MIHGESDFVYNHFYFTFHTKSKKYGYVWNRKILGKEKKNKENDFLTFGFIMENIKENQIYSKFLKCFYILKFLNSCIIERNK